MIYKTKDGVEFLCNFDEENIVKFKVNLPRTNEDFASGNGEGVWCACNEDDYKKSIEKDQHLFPVKILNDSVYYPNLRYGFIALVLSYDNTKRPIALRDELIYQFGDPISLLEKSKIIYDICNEKRGK